MIKSLISLIGIIILVLFQINFFSVFGLAPYINFILIIAVLISIYKGYRSSLIFCVISGVLLDFYSSFGFGSFTIALIVPIVVMFYIFRKLLAHRSIYTLVLVMIVSTVIFHLIFWSLVNLQYWLNWSKFNIGWSTTYLTQVGMQLITHSILAVIFYFSARFINNKIRANFFISEQI